MEVVGQHSSPETAANDAYSGHRSHKLQRRRGRGSCGLSDNCVVLIANYSAHTLDWERFFWYT